MTELLVRLFVKNSDQSEDPAVRAACGKLSGMVGIVCNCILFLGKLFSGIFSGSVSIMADAFNNLSDASSSVISLLGFKMAEKPADPEHPYGHARYEYLSGLMISVLILLIGFEMLKSSFDKILHPEPVQFSWLAAGILAASILLKLWMAAFNRKLGKKIASQTLLAAAADSRNDVISTGAVLLALFLGRWLPFPLDGFIGVAVAAFILYSGVGMLKDTLDPLLGKAPDPGEVRAIGEKICAYPGVLGVHDLIIHDYGPGRQFASVHVEMDADADVMESHDTLDNIERGFLETEGLHLVAHLDPIVTRDERVGAFRTWLAEEVKTIDGAMTVHDLRLVPGTTHTNAIFDVVVPAGFSMTDAQVTDAIRSLVREKYPDYFCVITVDMDFTSGAR